MVLNAPVVGIGVRMLGDLALIHHYVRVVHKSLNNILSLPFSVAGSLSNMQ